MKYTLKMVLPILLVILLIVGCKKHDNSIIAEPASKEADATETRNIRIKFIDGNGNPIPDGTLSFVSTSTSPKYEQFNEVNGTPITHYCDGTKVIFSMTANEKYHAFERELVVNGDTELTIRLYRRYNYYPVTPSIQAVQCELIYIKNGNEYDKLTVTEGGHSSEGWLYTYTINGTYIGDQYTSSLNPGEKCNLSNLYTRIEHMYNQVANDDAYVLISPSIHDVQDGEIYYKKESLYYRVQVQTGGDDINGWVHTYSVNGMYLGDQHSEALYSGDTCNLSPLYKKENRSTHIDEPVEKPK